MSLDFATRFPEERSAFVAVPGQFADRSVGGTACSSGPTSDRIGHDVLSRAHARIGGCVWIGQTWCGGDATRETAAKEEVQQRVGMRVTGLALTWTSDQIKMRERAERLHTDSCFDQSESWDSDRRRARARAQGRPPARSNLPIWPFPCSWGTNQLPRNSVTRNGARYHGKGCRIRERGTASTPRGARALQSVR